MKKTGRCPKCGSAEVYSGDRLDSWTKMGSYYNNIIPITAWRYATLDNFVCADCGHIESYISDNAKLALIRQKWVRVREYSFEKLGQPHSYKPEKCPNCGRELEVRWRACPWCGQMLD